MMNDNLTTLTHFDFMGMIGIFDPSLCEESAYTYQQEVKTSLEANIPHKETREAFLRAVKWFVAMYGEEYFTEYGDNFRIARIGNTAEEAVYQARKNKGCCGEIDVSYYDRETKLSFLVGCNYGH